MELAVQDSARSCIPVAALTAPHPVQLAFHSPRPLHSPRTHSFQLQLQPISPWRFPIRTFLFFAYSLRSTLFRDKLRFSVVIVYGRKCLLIAICRHRHPMTLPSFYFYFFPPNLATHKESTIVEREGVNNLTRRICP